jgi:hypothetical protein
MGRAKLPEDKKFVSATFRAPTEDMALVHKVVGERNISLAEYFREVIMKDVRSYLEVA